MVAQPSHPQTAVDLKSWFSYDPLIHKRRSISNTQTTVRGGRRKAGSGATEQGTDQQGRSGSGRGNEQVMNKFKLATRYKVQG